MTEATSARSAAAPGGAVSAGYNFSTPSSGQQPYIYFVAPPLSVSPPFDITVFIDDIFTTAPSAPIVSGPFTLQPTVPKDNQPGLPYKLTVPASSAAWQFDTSPIRQAMHDAFIAFLVAVENADGSHGAQKLKPGRLRLLQQYVAQTLPQTFAETLFFRYGLDPASRCVDVLPGMRLAVEYQAHQALDPQQNPLNGFVGSGSADIDVGATLSSSGNVDVTLGAFLPLLTTMAVTANKGGAAGSIDLQGQVLAYPYLRLLYPQTLTSSDSVGFTGIQQNPAIVGASSYADLTAATAQYVSSGTVPSNASAVFFRGRVTVLPRVPVFVQGITGYAPLGTTIRQLLAGLIAVPYMDTGKVAVPSQFYTRQRTVLSGQQSPPTWSFQPGQAAVSPPVNLASQAGGYAAYGPALDSFDLPVLGGDSLSVPLPQAN